MSNIDIDGFPSLELDSLLKLEKFKKMNDFEMINFQKKYMLDTSFPNASVETLLHAFLPFKFVDHSHSNAILSLIDQPNPIKICKKVFGDELGIVPFIMPGFDLAKKAYEVYKKNPKVLISGCGPIGLLLLKVLLNKVSEKNIYVLDINDNVLKRAKKIGNINTINIGNNPSFVKEYINYFDVSFEASGHTNSINNIVELSKRGADIIQVGNMPGGLIEINYNKVMIKELKIQGSYRFTYEFDKAVKKINNKEYEFQDILTHKFKLEN